MEAIAILPHQAPPELLPYFGRYVKIDAEGNRMKSARLLLLAGDFVEDYEIMVPFQA